MARAGSGGGALGVLMLDLCFVADLRHDPQSAAVADAIIRLSEALHLDVVAEGIEEHGQVTQLLNLGCSAGQGYYFARPQDAETLTIQLAPEFLPT